MAMTPNSESANSPSERSRTKNTPRIALKSVKTLAATMLEVDRDEVSGGGPSRASRAAASALDSPRSIAAASVIAGIYSGAAGRHLVAPAARDRLAPPWGSPGATSPSQLQRSPMISKKYFLPLAVVLASGLIAA